MEWSGVEWNFELLSTGTGTGRAHSEEEAPLNDRRRNPLPTGDRSRSPTVKFRLRVLSNEHWPSTEKAALVVVFLSS